MSDQRKYTNDRCEIIRQPATDNEYIELALELMARRREFDRTDRTPRQPKIIGGVIE